MRRAGASLIAIAVVAAAWTSVASAHAVIRPSASRPAELQLYTLVVPNERDVPTVGVEVKLPAGIDFTLVDGGSQWNAKLVQVNGRVDQIRWSGGTLKPGFFASFRFIARNPITAGSLSWRVVQRYSDGKDVFWIGPPDSDTPAARTLISESATPVDVVSGLNGGSAATPAPSPSGNGGEPVAAVDTAIASDGRDGLTLGLAIGAVVLGAAALAAVMLPRRRLSAASTKTEGTS